MAMQLIYQPELYSVIQTLLFLKYAKSAQIHEIVPITEAPLSFVQSYIHLL